MNRLASKLPNLLKMADRLISENKQKVLNPTRVFFFVICLLKRLNY